MSIESAGIASLDWKIKLRMGKQEQPYIGNRSPQCYFDDISSGVRFHIGFWNSSQSSDSSLSRRSSAIRCRGGYQYRTISCAERIVTAATRKRSGVMLAEPHGSTFLTSMWKCSDMSEHGTARVVEAAVRGLPSA